MEALDELAKMEGRLGEVYDDAGAVDDNQIDATIPDEPEKHITDAIEIPRCEVVV